MSSSPRDVPSPAPLLRPSPFLHTHGSFTDCSLAPQMSADDFGKAKNTEVRRREPCLGRVQPCSGPRVSTLSTSACSTRPTKSPAFPRVTACCTVQGPSLASLTAVSTPLPPEPEGSPRCIWREPGSQPGGLARWIIRRASLFPCVKPCHPFCDRSEHSKPHIRPHHFPHICGSGPECSQVCVRPFRSAPNSSVAGPGPRAWFPPTGVSGTAGVTSRPRAQSTTCFLSFLSLL